MTNVRVELDQYIPSGPLHAPLSVTREVSGVSDATHPLEKGEVCSVLFTGYSEWAESEDEGLTIN